MNNKLNLACGCHSIGSTSSSCDGSTGQCTCKTGYIGLKCADHCNCYGAVSNRSKCQKITISTILNILYTETAKRLL